MDTDLASRLALSLAIGLVVGLERGWREREARPGSRTAGIRTYTLCGLLGGIFGALASAVAAPLLIGLGFAAFVAVFAWFKRAEAVEDGDFSITGTVAAMLVFALGAFAVLGDMRLAAAGGIVTASILASREHLHRLLSRISWLELRSALLLLAMTAIVLPLLPDRSIDPLGAVNLRQIWLFTILVATLSYAGYVAMRALGPTKGVIVTGLTGGLVSSTAVTVALSRRAAAGEPAGILAAGVTTASAVSLLRVLVITTLVQPRLATALAPALVLAALAFLVPSLIAVLRAPAGGERDVTLGNPFDLGAVLFFAVLLALVSLAASWSNARFGAAGLFPVAAISGLIDVDAIALSTARLAGTSLDPSTAARAILVALAANAVARVAYAGVLERGGLTLRLAATTGAAIIVGLAGLLPSLLMDRSAALLQ
jgi:uncharacterized membrane protein (DUF4010 family)